MTTSPASRAALAAAALLLGGCSIAYREQHRTGALRLFHNAAEHAPDLDPQWAEAVFEQMALEFGVPLDGVAPVEVYIDCRQEARTSSRFNRLTKSILLKVGQADLERLYVHEIVHLLLDRIDGSPPYWVDQGLAEYMESRCARPLDARGRLPPPLLEQRSGNLIELEVAWSSAPELADRLSREAIDQGRGWAVPVIHYLLRRRWAGRPLSSQVRRLAELTRDDLDEIAPGFLDFCRTYDPAAELVEEYLEADGAMRRAILSEASLRHDSRRREALDELFDREEDHDLRREIARKLLAVEAPEAIGRTFERVAASLAPLSVPALDGPRADALASHLLERMRITPLDRRFPLVARFLAESGAARDLIPLAQAVSWLEGWPAAAAPLAARRDVQDHYLERLAAAGEAQIAAVLAEAPLVDFRSGGIFAGGEPARDEIGLLRLESRVEGLARLGEAERVALREKLRGVLRRGAREGPAAALRARAAVLIAYLGGDLDIRDLDPLDSEREDAAAFAAAFLPPGPRRQALERLETLLGSAAAALRAAGSRDLLDRRFILFAPQLGLRSLRGLHRELLADLEGPPAAALLAACSAYRDPELALDPAVRALIERPENEWAARVFIQLACGIDCGIAIRAWEQELSARAVPALLERGRPGRDEVLERWRSWIDGRRGRLAGS